MWLLSHPYNCYKDVIAIVIKVDELEDHNILIYFNFMKIVHFYARISFNNVILLFLFSSCIVFLSQVVYSPEVQIRSTVHLELGWCSLGWQISD